MKNYKVKSGFMAFQFGAPTWCIGIECNALAMAGEYHCIVGKGETEVDVSMETVNKLIEKYGKDKILRKQRGKNVYIVPVYEVKEGKGNDYDNK